MPVLCSGGGGCTSSASCGLLGGHGCGGGSPERTPSPPYPPKLGVGEHHLHSPPPPQNVTHIRGPRGLGGTQACSTPPPQFRGAHAGGVRGVDPILGVPHAVPPPPAHLLPALPRPHPDPGGGRLSHRAPLPPYGGSPPTPPRRPPPPPRVPGAVLPQAGQGQPQSVGEKDPPGPPTHTGGRGAVGVPGGGTGGFGDPRRELGDLREGGRRGRGGRQGRPIGRGVMRG